jgi:hypothetical protein
MREFGKTGLSRRRQVAAPTFYLFFRIFGPGRPFAVRKGLPTQLRLGPGIGWDRQAGWCRTPHGRTHSEPRVARARLNQTPVTTAAAIHSVNNLGPRIRYHAAADCGRSGSNALLARQLDLLAGKRVHSDLTDLCFRGKGRNRWEFRTE